MNATQLFPPEEVQPDDKDLSALTAQHLKRIADGFRDLETAVTVTQSKVNPIDKAIAGLPGCLKAKRPSAHDHDTYETYVDAVKSVLDQQALEFIPDKTFTQGPNGIEDKDVAFKPLADIAESTEFLLKLVGSHIGYERKRDLVLPLLKAAHKTRSDALRGLRRGETPQRRMLRDHAHLLNLLEHTCTSYLKAKDSASDEVAIAFFTDPSGTVRPITVHLKRDVNR